MSYRRIQVENRNYDDSHRPSRWAKSNGHPDGHSRVRRRLETVFGEVSVKGGSPFLTRHKVENGAQATAANAYQQAQAVLPRTGDQVEVRTRIETQMRQLGVEGKE